MNAPVFLGDEVSAAGWRLAGTDVLSPPPGAECAALDAALAQSPLVVLSAEFAARLPEETLRAALRSLAPLTVIVPDLRGTTPTPDITVRLKRQLGIEA
jgi:vacuolar-type H+-ATPase subunit F/Vma7